MEVIQTSLPVVERTNPDAIVKHMHEDGAVIIPNLLKKNEVEEMKAMIDRLEYLGADARASSGWVDHYKCVFNRNPYWLSFIDMEGVIDAVEGIMGEDCHIIGMSAWRTPPGHGSFGYHVDQLMNTYDEELLVSGRVQLPIYYSTLHFYLNDMTKELCPTWVVPGSHKSGRGPGPEDELKGKLGFVGGTWTEWNGVKAEPVLVSAGDAMLFRSEVWHSGSPNITTDQTRYLLQVHYSRRSIAQRFPPYLDFHYNSDVLRAASDRQLRLLGKHKQGAYG